MALAMVPAGSSRPIEKIVPGPPHRAQQWLLNVEKGLVC
jgi:hypothetical protein